MNMNRRGLITGLGSLFLVAPAIVRASSLDMIRGVPLHPKIKINLEWRYIVHNEFGGIVRWVAAPGEEWGILSRSS